MPVFYLDASAIVKYYIREPGTDFIVQLFENSTLNDTFYTSYISIIEVTSAVMRRAKGNEFTETTAREILIQFNGDVGQILLPWPLNHEIVADAVSVAENHGLRAGDAIHLATALQIDSIDSNTSVFMISSDRELLSASESSDITGAADPISSGSLNWLNEIRN